MYFRNFKLGTKLYLGFLAVLLLMLLSGIVGSIGIITNNGYFTNYRNISNQQKITSDIQTALLNTRIAYTTVVQKSDISQQNVFLKNYLKMNQLVKDFKDKSSNVKVKESMDDLSYKASQYNNSFYKLLDLIFKRNTLYSKFLSAKGDETLANITSLVNHSSETKNLKLLSATANLRYRWMNIRLHVMKYLHSNYSSYIEIVKNDYKALNKNMDECKKYLVNSNETSDFNVIDNDKDDYYDSFLQMVDTISQENDEIRKMDMLGPQISTIISKCQVLILNEQNQMGPQVDRNNKFSIVIIIVVDVVAFIFAAIISLLIVKQIVHPVMTISNTFYAISEGETNLSVRINNDTQDEIGQMSRYFDKFMDKLQAIFNDIKTQNYIKSGLSELGRKMGNDNDVQKVAEEAVHFVCEYVLAQIGTLFLACDNGNYRLASGFAYTKNNGVLQEFVPGEGLVGQCVIEKKILYLDEIPENYLRITSGFGQIIPKHILLVPCIIEERTLAVMEIGTLEKLGDNEIKFIEQASNVIASELNSAFSREKVKELLEKTIHQSEELQMQQEELRQTNEELEEQTYALRKSEMVLKEQREELRQTNEELEEQAKALEIAGNYKTEFLANMSHELRTPLNSILVLSQMLGDKAAGSMISKKELEYAKTINSSGSELLTLINDILDISKVEAGRLDILFEKVELSDVEQSIKRTFGEMIAAKGLYLKTIIEEGLPHFIISDSMRLLQILKNLMSNALKFTESGGITLNIRRPTSNELYERGIESRQAVAFSIMDTGIGISKEKHDLIFEAFRQADGTTSRKFGGTGLGLTISRELSLLIGGGICLDSKEGEGSSFTLVLPEEAYCELNGVKYSYLEQKTAEPFDYSNGYSEQDIQEYEEPTEIEAIPIGLKTVLIVDDDETFANVISNLVKEKGFWPIVAYDGEKGLKMAEQYWPEAIILDIGLPGLNGWEVLERLKKSIRTRHIPVHIISGHENSDFIDDKAIVGYFQKPIDMAMLENLLQNIRNILVILNDLHDTESIMQGLYDRGITSKSAYGGLDGLEELDRARYDCVIIDIKLKDMSVYRFFEELKIKNMMHIPIIIYTDTEISEREADELNKFASSIILKGPKSSERLLDETNLFLYGVGKKSKNIPLDTDFEGIDKEEILKGKKILLIDDDMRNVFALTGMLELKGMHVVVGKNGKEGIERLESNPDIDLVLMDIMMPEMDGYAAMRSIRRIEKWQNIPIIALTAKSMKEDRNRCIEAGANDYLSKPIEPERLISLIRVWLYSGK